MYGSQFWILRVDTGNLIYYTTYIGKCVICPYILCPCPSLCPSVRLLVVRMNVCDEVYWAVYQIKRIFLKNTDFTVNLSQFVPISKYCRFHVVYWEWVSGYLGDTPRIHPDLKKTLISERKRGKSVNLHIYFIPFRASYNFVLLDLS